MLTLLNHEKNMIKLTRLQAEIPIFSRGKPWKPGRASRFGGYSPRLGALKVTAGKGKDGEKHLGNHT